MFTFEKYREKIEAKILGPGEKIKYKFGPSKIFINFWLFLGLAIILIVFIWISDIFTIGLALGLVLILYSIYLRLSYFYFFTDRRILALEGLFNTKVTSVDYQKITDVKVIQPFLIKLLFSAGTLLINTAGTPKVEIVLPFIASPYQVKQKLDVITQKGKLIF